MPGSLFQPQKIIENYRFFHLSIIKSSRVVIT